MSLDLPRAEKLRLRLWLQMLKATRHIEAELRENSGWSMAPRCRASTSWRLWSGGRTA